LPIGPPMRADGDGSEISLAIVTSLEAAASPSWTVAPGHHPILAVIAAAAARWGLHGDIAARLLDAPPSGGGGKVSKVARRG
jgi:hypothetical protein